MVDGFHVPVSPFCEVVGSGGGVLLKQSEPIGANVGVTCDETTISIVVVVPHWPADGVNVWVVVPAIAVLIVAGLQVPFIPLEDVPGNNGALLFWQSGPICVNVGLPWFVIVIAIVVAVPH